MLAFGLEPRDRKAKPFNGRTVQVLQRMLPQPLRLGIGALVACHIGKVDDLIQVRHTGSSGGVAADGGKNFLVVHAVLCLRKDGCRRAVPHGRGALGYITSYYSIFCKYLQ